MAFDEAKKDFNLIGTRPARPDGIDKVTGRAQFGADKASPGQLHAAILRSPHAHALIKSIDTSAAEKAKDVKGIVTRADFATGLKGEMWNIWRARKPFMMVTPSPPWQQHLRWPQRMR